MRTNILPKWLAGTLAAVVMFATCMAAETASAKTLAEVLRENPDMQKFLEDIDGIITNREEEEVAVAPLQGDSFTSSGRALSKVIKELVDEKTSLSVVRRAKFTVKGDYSFAGINEDTQRIEVIIKCRITDKSLAAVAAIDTGLKIEDVGAIAEIMGVTVEPSQASEDVDTSDPEEVEEAREEKAQAEQVEIAAAIENPQVEIADTVVQAKKGSKFGIEILAAGADSPGDFAPRAAENDDGLAFVPLGQGEVYAIRITNNAEYDVALTLLIDGINHFTFCDPEFKIGKVEAADPIYKHIIIPAGTTDRVIKGWWKNHKQFFAFFVTENSKSASARLGVSDSIGTITATFAAAWEEGDEPPPDELPVEESEAQGTGVGTEGEHVTTEVRRFVGAPRSIISVRYERP